MNKKNSRNIDKEIRDALREEVGFGCPINNCGSPYLEYHHFNPPWKECQCHNPENMIALCGYHHDEADTGAYTNEQLYKFKKEPYLKQININPNGKFNWKRNVFVLCLGANWYINSSLNFIHNNINILKIDGLDSNNSKIDFSIFNNNKEKIFEMIDNEWNITTKIFDLESPPSKKNLFLKSEKEKFEFSLSFKNYTVEEFRIEYKKYLTDMVLYGIIASVSELNVEEIMTEIMQNMFLENEIKQPKIIEELSKELQITTISFKYKSEYPKINITQDSIKINKNKIPVEGNLYYKSSQTINI